MIKLKTQLTATVSQKELETMITDMINTQLGIGSHIAEVNFVWSEKSVTVTGIQQKFEELASTAPKLATTSEVPFDVIEAIVKQPTAALQDEQPRLPFAPIEKESIFKQVDTTKKELGIVNTSSFPSVTNKFLVQ